MRFDDILLTSDAGVATVTLHRPDRLNAMNLTMVQHLRAVLDECARDPEVRAVVVTGAGRGFCAGGDMSDLASGGRGSLDGLAALVRRCTAVAELLRAMPKPVIAAVNGPCAGAGLALACAADLRLASANAVFTTAFVAAGQTGDYGLAWTLPRLVGTGRARELFFTARRVDAEEAARLGLAEEVCPPDALLPRAQSLAASIAARAPLTVAAIKASLGDAEVLHFADFLDREAERYEANARTEDAAEAARAFVEKREPNFRGR